MNCPVTVKDIIRAVDIWGRDLGTVKGKTTRKPSQEIKNVDAEIKLFTDKEVLLYVDLCKIRGLEFFVSISDRLCLMAVVYLPNRSKKSILKALEDIAAVYGRFGIKIKAIYCDGEGGVAAIKSKMEISGTVIETTAKNEHVAEAERANRTLKERVRSFTTTLPYKLPNIMIIHLVYYCVTMINSFRKVSAVGMGKIPPKELLTGRKIDYKKDCSLKFGEYVQVHDDEMITNTLNERTLGAIVLGPIGNVQGSYSFLNLKTWKVIKRRAWVQIPMSSLVIDRINEKAEADIEMLKSKLGENFELEENDYPIILEEVEESSDEESIPDEMIELDKEESSESDAESENSGVDSEEENPIPEIVYEEPPEIPVLPKPVLPKPAKVNLPSREGLRPYKPPSWSKNAQMATVEKVALAAKKGNVYLRDVVKIHGFKGLVSIMKEMRQMHKLKTFHPVKKSELTPEQRKKTYGSILFSKVKRDQSLKSRLCLNGSQQDREDLCIDPNSPTVSAEAVYISLAIESEEKRIVWIVDIIGAYLHAKMRGDVFMILEPLLADMMATIDPMYKTFIDEEGNLWVKLDQALYGCVESARLFYEHLSNTVQEMGFVRNPYDHCVFNKTYPDGTQVTLLFHVDDLKISCFKIEHLEDTIDGLKKVYGTLAVHKELVLDYLGTDMDYSIPGEVTLSMKKMVIQTIEEFEKIEKLGCPISTPALDGLFQVKEDAEALSPEKKKAFHSLVARILYMAKRARPDLLTAVSFLTTRVLFSTEEDWEKLKRLVRYMSGTREMKLRIASKNLKIEAYIDASYATHQDRKSHTGMYVTLGEGCIYAKSSKQKLVSKSSTEAELIAVADCLPVLLWMRLFLDAQGYGKQVIKIYQDNLSTVTLIEKGRSTSNRTRHIDIRYFLVHDKIAQGEIEVGTKSSEDMTGDYFSKELQGRLCVKFIKEIMNIKE